MDSTWIFRVVQRKYALFFHGLSILEGATDHECINNCNHPKEMWVGFKCNGLIIFLREEVRFPPSPTSPPPASPPLLGSLPPFPLHPPSSVVVGWDISGSGAPAGMSLKRRVTRQIWQWRWHIWWIRVVGEFGRSAGGRRWPAFPIWIRIKESQMNADPGDLDPDPQHCKKFYRIFSSRVMIGHIWQCCGSASLMGSGSDLSLMMCILNLIFIWCGSGSGSDFSLNADPDPAFCGDPESVQDVIK